MNTDTVHLAVSNADAERVARVSFQLICRLQDESPGVQVAALTALFMLFCETAGLRPADLYSYLTNMMADPLGTGRLKHFQAIKTYIEEDCKWMTA